MNTQKLKQSLSELFRDHKGLLAMDESIPTCNKRFEANGIPQTPEMRRAYRELLITTPGLGTFISGAILCDETMKQAGEAGIPFPQMLAEAGIIPGIKVDMGTVNLEGFPGEKVTEGLDGLQDRLVEYVKLGARFAKWRAVISIGSELPSAACIRANMHILSRYAVLCQETGLVPIVEPEVLMEGDHSLQRCSEVTAYTLLTLFTTLRLHRGDISSLILKANMVLPGAACPVQNTAEEIADVTIKCLLDSVPASVPAIAFLSGGQSSELASARLNAMHKRYKDTLPWYLTFSFSRALQDDALKIWNGKKANTEKAQAALLHRAKCNSAAMKGSYSALLEQDIKLN
jgi:fructose-bisphosphate aldolase class I